MNNDTLMPALFIGHGSPMNAITLNRFSLSWYQLGRQIPTPRAIIVISSHFTTQGITAITAMDAPKTIYDFVGFPAELMEINYAAKGSPFIASHIVKSLESFTPIYEDYTDWGFDHATWTILSHMYPDANIPVLELSIDLSKPPSFHHLLGRALGALRQQGYLIIGSGNVVHNLRQLKWELDQTPYAWAENFNQFVYENIDNHAFTEEHPLVNFQEHPDWRLAHPTTEHYLPLLYILGAWTGREKVNVFNNVILQGSLSMLSFMVGDNDLSLSLEVDNIEGAAYGGYTPPTKLSIDFFDSPSENETTSPLEDEENLSNKAIKTDLNLDNDANLASENLEEAPLINEEENNLPKAEKSSGFFSFFKKK